MADKKQPSRPAILIVQALFELALTLSIAALWLQGGLELSIRAMEGDEPLVTVPLEAGERFTLNYIRTVGGNPVREDYYADEFGNIYIDEEKSPIQEAGMGRRKGHGIPRRVKPYQFADNTNERIGDLIIRAGEESTNHIILWRDTTLDLSKLAPGKGLLISAVPISKLERLWHNL